MGFDRDIPRTLRGLVQRLIIRLGGTLVAALIAFGALRDNGDLQDAFGEFVVVGAVFGGAMLLLACAAILYGAAALVGYR